MRTLWFLLITLTVAVAASPMFAAIAAAGPILRDP